jgi:hypothetical protein
MDTAGFKHVPLNVCHVSNFKSRPVFVNHAERTSVVGTPRGGLDQQRAGFTGRSVYGAFVLHSSFSRIGKAAWQHGRALAAYVPRIGKIGKVVQRPAVFIQAVPAVTPLKIFFVQGIHRASVLALAAWKPLLSGSPSIYVSRNRRNSAITVPAMLIPFLKCYFLRFHRRCQWIKFS